MLKHEESSFIQSKERDWPDPALILGEEAVDITLRYDGPLPACQRDDETKEAKLLAKQALRLKFSEQLRNIWETSSILIETIGENRFAPAILENRRIKLEHPHLGQKWAHARVEAFGYRIIPLVTFFSGLICHLNIKFLRRDEPGGIFNAGDLDNRLKTLLDSLRMPQCSNEIVHNGNGEDLYCLLEDDSLVTRITIDAQKLMTNRPTSEPDNYAELFIDASIKILRPHNATKFGY